jgi:hypothetical protein
MKMKILAPDLNPENDLRNECQEGCLMVDMLGLH